ncbi:CBN-SRH-45 protein [Caenorhabditis brenneri]|uniref:CBN-SRH-45 protein n=1 Tax=Caenorhabditis brenneri TaxID=135651 RepID=G0N8P3_CAEBE|nr:CBN-SRH-45 protein [Caenorhabditis brenneri]
MATSIIPELESYYSTQYLLKCSKETHFLETERFLEISACTLFFFTTPINFFGIYCIVFKTPNEMITIKWCMLYLHSLATFSSLWLTAAMMPFVYFPACAGFTTGLLPYMNVSTQIQGYIGIGCLGMLALSLPILFENRQRYLVDNYKITRPVFRVMFYTLNVLFVPFSLFGLFSIVPDQVSARQQVLQFLPCPTESYFHHSVFVLSLNHIPVITYLSALSTVTVIQILFFGGHSLTYLRTEARKISVGTRKLQKRFFMVISVQLILPCIILLIPVVYFIYSMLSGYYNQALNNISFVTMTLYGATATLTMILLHNPYKKFVLNLFFSREKSSIEAVKPRKWVRRNAVSVTTPVSF